MVPAPPPGSPDTSAESSSNRDERIEDDHHSLSLSHNDDTLDGEDQSSTGRSSKSRDEELDEIAKRQQHVALTRCAALFLVLAVAAGAGVATYVLTSRESEEAVADQVCNVSCDCCDCILFVALLLESSSL